MLRGSVRVDVASTFVQYPAGASPGGGTQRLRGQAGQERARAAEQVAVDDRDRRAAGARVMRRRLARGAGTDHHEIERALGHRSALYQSSPPPWLTKTSRRSP